MTSTSVCPRCSSPLAEIHLDQAGRTMVMRSCSACDSRWWERDGEQVALGAVLDTVASSKRVAAENKLAAAAAR